MPKRKLKVKLTPIALSVCEFCNMKFQCREWVERFAAEMSVAFKGLVSALRTSPLSAPFRQ
jgi:hypothetical protein